MPFISIADMLGIPRSMADMYKPAAKKFTYSSAVNKEIIEQRLSDIATTTGRTVSEVIEDTLADTLLTSDGHARYYVNGALLGKKLVHPHQQWEHYGIRYALVELFDEVSAGTGWAPRYTNTKPLVEFTARILKDHGATLIPKSQSGHYGKLYDLENNFDSVCSKLEFAAKDDDSGDLEIEAKFARQNIFPAIPEGEADPIDLVRVVTRNWEILNETTYTFRMLSTLMSACRDWDDAPADRILFQEICDAVMSEWTRAEQEEELRRQQAEIDAQLVQHPIADGDFVLYPRGWLVVNATIAPFAHYAGVIEIKHGVRYDAPHFLFFSENLPVADMPRDEKKKLIEEAEKIWPDMEKVRRDEVELEYNPDGGIKNLAEFSAAPCIGFFPIRDRGDYAYGKPPYGAEIIRSKSAGK